MRLLTNENIPLYTICKLRARDTFDELLTQVFQS